MDLLFYISILDIMFSIELSSSGSPTTIKTRVSRQSSPVPSTSASSTSPGALEPGFSVYIQFPWSTASIKGDTKYSVASMRITKSQEVTRSRGEATTAKET